MAYRLSESGPLAATGVLFSANVANERGVTFWVDDNGGGSTLTVETSADNSSWTAYTAGYRLDPALGAVALALSTFSTRGVYFFPLNSVNYIRVRVSAYVSGYVRVRWEETTQFVPPAPGGFVAGFYKTSAYTFTLNDANSAFIHPAEDTTARTWTIPAKSAVDFPINTAITFINQNGAGALTIAITTDTMRLAGAGTTGSRTLAANGVATAVKIGPTEWIISGTGLT